MNESELRNAMRTHGNTVYRLALCRMQNIADAEDVYQDVFLRLISQDVQEWEQEHLKAWLIRATLNRCTDIRRFRFRRSVLPLESIPGYRAAWDEETTDGISAAELWAAVAGLPVKLRTVIHLHYAEGYSTEEIAAMLGVPASTVRTRLYRARERLKTLLGGLTDA